MLINAVGYQTSSTDARAYSGGPTFLAVGNVNGKVRLGDVTVTGMDPDLSDFVQFLTTDNAKTYLMATYVDEAKALYYGDPSYKGWWNYEKMGEEDGKIDDMDLDAGIGFLGSLSSGNAMKFTFPDLLAK